MNDSIEYGQCYRIDKLPKPNKDAILLRFSAKLGTNPHKILRIGITQTTKPMGLDYGWFLLDVSHAYCTPKGEIRLIASTEYMEELHSDKYLDIDIHNVLQIECVKPGTRIENNDIGDLYRVTLTLSHMKVLYKGEQEMTIRNGDFTFFIDSKCWINLLSYYSEIPIVKAYLLQEMI